MKSQEDSRLRWHYLGMGHRRMILSVFWRAAKVCALVAGFYRPTFTGRDCRL